MTTWAKLLGQTDILLAVGIITIVGMMIVPLPTVLLDVLLTINIVGIGDHPAASRSTRTSRCSSRCSRRCC